MFKRVADEVTAIGRGMHEITLATLARRFATAFSTPQKGDLYAVNELLGHSSTRVTEVCLHSSRTRTESAVRALREYRRGNRQTETPRDPT